MKGEREESVSRITSCLRDGETGVGDVFLLAKVGVQENQQGKKMWFGLKLLHYFMELNSFGHQFTLSTKLRLA